MRARSHTGANKVYDYLRTTIYTCKHSTAYGYRG